MENPTEVLQKLSDLHPPFYQTWDFWLSFILSVAGLVASLFSFKEARAAKKAANEAGRTVKIQTITIELSEILQKLDNLKPHIDYHEARTLGLRSS